MVGSVNVTANGTPTPIVPYTEVNGGAWQTTNSVTVQYSDSVNLGPQPLTGGSWSWTGPNGYTSTAREIDSIPLTLPTNVFVATYTNPSGVKSTETFTITVAPTAITPYLQVNGANWQTIASATVQLTDAVNLGPQPLNGSWSWTGPGGFTSTSRQINSIPLTSATNVFVATYTNPAGVKSTQTFTISIAPTTITPYIQVGNGAWASSNSTFVFPGELGEPGSATPDRRFVELDGDRWVPIDLAADQQHSAGFWLQRLRGHIHECRRNQEHGDVHDHCSLEQRSRGSLASSFGFRHESSFVSQSPDINPASATGPGTKAEDRILLLTERKNPGRLASEMAGARLL